MKYLKLLNQLFAVFCYLTLGSFFVIVAFHWWPLEDAIETLYRVYHSYSFSVLTGLIGCGFIFLGLVILRLVVKTNPQNEALVCRTDAGIVVVSGRAIEDIARKVIKKSSFVRDHKMKLNIRGQFVSLNLRMGFWAHDSLATVVQEIQEEIRARLQKLLGHDNQLEVSCEIDRIYNLDEIGSENKTDRSVKVSV